MTRPPFLLLVDDDAELTDVLADALALEGFAVRVAHDGESGLALAGDDTGLVLLDLRMPGISGFDFVRRYRERRGLLTPIYVFSALRHAHRVARSIGADGVVQKPFDLDELIRLAERHLTRRSSHAAAS
jgi:two-component system response regulator CpxR